jgi:hypothetical protein
MEAGSVLKASRTTTPLSRYSERVTLDDACVWFVSLLVDIRRSRNWNLRWEESEFSLRVSLGWQHCNACILSSVLEMMMMLQNLGYG